MKFTPYTVHLSAPAVDDLRFRLDATRWPAQLVDDWSHGMPVAVARQLASEWRALDFGALQRQLNRFEQVTTEIEGQRFHVVHARGSGGGIPLLIAHGYPSCFVEYLPVVEMLTERGFDVVVPSLPGFGFSTPLTPEWSLPRIASAYDRIMTGLGYQRYGVLAGDVGAGVATELALITGKRLIGTLLLTDPGALGTPYTPQARDLEPHDTERLLGIAAARAEDFGYLAIQQSRPQSVAFGLADSPMMQLAWIAEKVYEWRGDAEQTLAQAVDIETLLAIATVFWFGGGGAGAAELLWTVAHSEASWGAVGSQPRGYAAFGREPLQRKVLDPESALFWSEHDHGGHFPALQAPRLLVDDVQSFFDSLA